MRRFKSFDDLEVFFHGINAAYDFLHPSSFRDCNFRAVLKCLSDSRSSLHCFGLRPIYVIFGPDICCSTIHLSLEEARGFSTRFCVFKVYFTEKNIIVNQL